MTATAPLVERARRELADLDDRITGPGDPGYDEARAVHNAMIDRHPALIVRCDQRPRMWFVALPSRGPTIFRSRSAAVDTTAAVWVSSTTGS